MMRRCTCWCGSSTRLSRSNGSCCMVIHPLHRVSAASSLLALPLLSLVLPLRVRHSTSDGTMARFTERTARGGAMGVLHRLCVLCALLLCVGVGARQYADLSLREVEAQLQLLARHDQLLRVSDAHRMFSLPPVSWVGMPGVCGL